MALINCPECNKEISDKANICINCGYPIAELKILKKESLEIIIELRICKWKNGYDPNYYEYLNYIDDYALSDIEVVEEILDFVCDDIGLQLTEYKRHNFNYIQNWLYKKRDLFPIEKVEHRNIAIKYLTIRKKILTAREMLFGVKCYDEIAKDIKWVKECCSKLFDDSRFIMFLEENFKDYY